MQAGRIGEFSARGGCESRPEDAGGWARLGLATQGATQGAESLRALETAVLLNPRDSHSLIDLALRSEKAGDAPKARAYLDQATEIDRGYLPLWTAANFALRHHEVRFAALLHRAFAIAIKGGQDPVPLFDLAWQASGEAGFIATEIVGTETQCQRVYIAYLSEQQRFDALATCGNRTGGETRSRGSADVGRCLRSPSETSS